MSTDLFDAMQNCIWTSRTMKKKNRYEVGGEKWNEKKTKGPCHVKNHRGTIRNCVKLEKYKIMHRRKQNWQVEKKYIIPATNKNNVNCLCHMYSWKFIIVNRKRRAYNIRIEQKIFGIFFLLGLFAHFVLIRRLGSFVMFFFFVCCWLSFCGFHAVHVGSWWYPCACGGHIECIHICESFRMRLTTEKYCSFPLSLLKAQNIKEQKFNQKHRPPEISTNSEYCKRSTRYDRSTECVGLCVSFTFPVGSNRFFVVVVIWSALRTIQF